MDPDDLRSIACRKPSGFMAREALSAAADEIERLQAKGVQVKAVADLIEYLGKHSTEQAAENERLRAALEQIDTWSRAYPLQIFPEPDLAKAAELLKAGGMTLDAISAHAMRHVVEGVGKIARDALGTDTEQLARGE